MSIGAELFVRFLLRRFARRIPKGLKLICRAPPVAAECQPFQPSQPDVFMSQTKSSSRGVLRPSFSYGNTGTQPTSWNRRIATDSIVPSSTSSRHDHGQGREHVENAPPAMGSFAAPPPVPVHANATAPSPYTAHIDPALGAESKVQPSSYPPPPSHTPQHNPQQPPPSGPPSNATPYSDEYPFHNNSGSYDASFGSPWTANSSLEYPHAQQHPPPAGFFPGPHPFYVTTSNGKKTTREPILAPGEVPAPRPPLSYASLIGEALLLAPPPHQLYVSEISESIKRRYQCECDSILPSCSLWRSYCLRYLSTAPLRSTSLASWYGQRC